MSKLHKTWGGLNTEFLSATIALCVLGMAGCKPSPMLDSPETSRIEVREDEYHDHEHEHGIPDHKPESFAAAVRRLVPQWKHLAAERRAGHQKHADAELAIMLDVIRWLPELAADTELRKADWDRVQQLSKELESMVHAPPPVTTTTASIEIETLVGQLQKLAESTGSAAPEPPPATAEHFIDSDPQDFAK